MNALDYILLTDGAAFDLDEATLIAACASLGKRSKLDRYGVAPEAILLFCVACPHVAIVVFEFAMSSTPRMSSVVVKGRLSGKES